MKCPKCGAQIEAGKLYCEACGEEIRIVPDFDPELENSIRETLDGVAQELAPAAAEDGGEASPGAAAQAESRKERLKRARLIWIGSVAAMMAGLVVLFLALWFYMSHSPDFQMHKAAQCLNEQNYSAARKYLERAAGLEPKNVEYQLRLAECYELEGNMEAAEKGYLYCLSLDRSSLEAYQHLIAYYDSQQQYEAINTLLKDCSDENVLNQFAAYLANPPEFSLPEGTYFQVQALKLLSNTAGTIYFTMDGSMPGKDSQIYTSPIFLENGTYVIRAMFVNGYGVQSETAASAYNIDAAMPLAPDVSVYSGIYTVPTQIEVAEQEDCVVHYTVDGSEPNQDSPIYYGPVDMPLGASCFKFIAYSKDGVPGEVTVRNYELQLETVLSVEEAQNVLVQQLITAGILEVDGSIANMDGHTLYEYTAVMAIEGGNYYFFTEYYEDAAALRNKTGNFYVVDVSNGGCFQALPNDAGSYDLQPI